MLGIVIGRRLDTQIQVVDIDMRVRKRLLIKNDDGKNRIHHGRHGDAVRGGVDYFYPTSMRSGF
jgi:hypothetical protein